ncbi:hypothetical protein BDV37DRAFT_265137 [Aspergillus pseudonomiae]|uniref:Protein kinase domain-containing protein n=1 Tax=Aspergillus pseudonomiae TaxID=1506151 RepID=A0A5N7CU81_9EURO|nr:uncharacterized protein BDV37DRAFT_265137 [Aspergillus pseudonomiae]KAE8397671.1 hypothetical protein BDV37DRAFT_265137 [Aspergillus pseudonomiae]
MNMPILRHPGNSHSLILHRNLMLINPDLNPSNVFVSDTCEVSCIVNWQHSSILPLLLTAGNPPLFENPDSEPPKGLEKPSLPENYSSLSPEEQSNADELHRRRMLFYMYMVFNGRDNKAHLEALRYPLMSLRQHIVDRAGRQWSGNVITLKGALIRLTEHVLKGTGLRRRYCSSIGGLFWMTQEKMDGSGMNRTKQLWRLTRS